MRSHSTSSQLMICLVLFVALAESLPLSRVKRQPRRSYREEQWQDWPFNGEPMDELSMEIAERSGRNGYRTNNGPYLGSQPFHGSVNRHEAPRGWVLDQYSYYMGQYQPDYYNGDGYNYNQRTNNNNNNNNNGYNQRPPSNNYNGYNQETPTNNYNGYNEGPPIPLAPTTEVPRSPYARPPIIVETNLVRTGFVGHPSDGYVTPPSEETSTSYNFVPLERITVSSESTESTENESTTSVTFNRASVKVESGFEEEFIQKAVSEDINSVVTTTVESSTETSFVEADLSKAAGIKLLIPDLSLVQIEETQSAGQSTTPIEETTTAEVREIITSTESTKTPADGSSTDTNLSSSTIEVVTTTPEPIAASSSIPDATTSSSEPATLSKTESTVAAVSTPTVTSTEVRIAEITSSATVTQPSMTPSSSTTEPSVTDLVIPDDITTTPPAIDFSSDRKTTEAGLRSPPLPKEVAKKLEELGITIVKNE